MNATHTGPASETISIAAALMARGVPKAVALETAFAYATAHMVPEKRDQLWAILTNSRTTVAA